MFIEKSYVLASIFRVKMNEFRESFVTCEELNEITRLIQKRFNDDNINAIIVDEIDYEYYEFNEVYVINKKEDKNIIDILNRFFGSCHQIEILSYIWDEKFILDTLICMREEKLKIVREKTSTKVYKKYINI